MLALLADFIPPRVFYQGDTFVRSSTLSMQVTLHAAPDEIADVGERHVLVDLKGRRIGDGINHTARSGARRAASSL